MQQIFSFSKHALPLAKVPCLICGQTWFVEYIPTYTIQIKQCNKCNSSLSDREFKKKIVFVKNR